MNLVFSNTKAVVVHKYAERMERDLIVQALCMSLWRLTSYGRKGIFPLYTNWMLNNLAAAEALGAADGLQGNEDNSAVIFHILQSIIFKD